MVRSLKDNNTLFNIEARVFQIDTFVSYIFIRFLNYVLRVSMDLMKEYGFN